MHIETETPYALRLTCDDHGLRGYIPSGETYAVMVAAMICLCVLLIARLRSRGEKLLVVVALTGVVASAVPGLFLSYEADCWHTFRNDPHEMDDGRYPYSRPKSN